MQVTGIFILYGKRSINPFLLPLACLPIFRPKKTKTAFAIQLNNVVLCSNYYILMMKDDFRPRISNDYEQDAALYMFEIEV